MISSALFALLRCAVVVVAALGLRLDGIRAAGLALAVTLLLSGLGAFGKPTPEKVGEALADGLLLTLVVEATVVPGVLFIKAVRRLDAGGEIARLVAALELSQPQAAVLIALGVGFTVESLTGMGVSLLVTLSLLASRVPRREAIMLALIGISLVPWGAFALSATVGAKLGDIQASDVACVLWLVSGPVAIVLPMLAVLVAGSFTRRDVMAAMAAGVTMWAAIGLASALLGVELAGVAGGPAVIGVMLLFAARGTDLGAALAAPGLKPYLILIACVLAQKLMEVLLAHAGIELTLASPRVSFQVLSSPGMALVAAVLMSRAGPIDGALLAATVRRCTRVIAARALFLLTARLLVSSGAIDALAASVADLGKVPALVATGLLGALSGFVTGSGISGNALFLPSAATTGRSSGCASSLRWCPTRPRGTRRSRHCRSRPSC